MRVHVLVMEGVMERTLCGVKLVVCACSSVRVQSVELGAILGRGLLCVALESVMTSEFCSISRGGVLCFACESMARR